MASINALQFMKKGADLKYFFALSRTPHGLIDMTVPAAAALLCLGHFPSLSVTLIGLITIFAGYTAVYALNDVVDVGIDKKKVAIGGCGDNENYLDGALTRHPMAKGLLSISSGVIWTVCWSVVAIAGAYWLNPVCLYIFVAGCALEGAYCLLWRVTPLRALVNGLVKTLGAMAAVYAVNPSPPLSFLLVLFLWIFCWEIGGQNIPCDWTDIEEDRYFKAKTIPIYLGAHRAGLIAAGTLVCAMFLHFILLWVSPLKFGAPLLFGALAANVCLLLWPVLKLAEARDRKSAMNLFNKASYYPAATLVLALVMVFAH
ncbi:MAG: UbiA family prenyltransferase [Desulfobacteraceae bacterium]